MTNLYTLGIYWIVVLPGLARVDRRKNHWNTLGLELEAIANISGKAQPRAFITTIGNRIDILKYGIEKKEVT